MDVLGRYEFIVNNVPLIKELRVMVADYIGMEIVGKETQTVKELHLIIGMVGDTVYTRCLPYMRCPHDGIKCLAHLNSIFGDYTSLRPICDEYVLLTSVHLDVVILNTKTNENMTIYDAIQACVHDNRVFYIRGSTDELCIWSPDKIVVVPGRCLHLCKLGHCLCIAIGNGLMKLWGEKVHHPRCKGVYKWKDRYYYIHDHKVEDETDHYLPHVSDSFLALKGFIYLFANYRHYIWDLERRKIVAIDNSCDLEVADEKRLYSTHAQLLIYE